MTSDKTPIVKFSALFVGLGLIGASPVFANESTSFKTAEPNTKVEVFEDEHGTTNPEELSMKYYIKNMNRNLKRGHDFVCALGYMATKSGNHDDAVKIFKTCSNHGNQGTKVWMSYMHQNGFGVEKSAEKAAEWVKDAATHGYSIGEYNYGLALIRGNGVKRDMEAGKAMIKRAAKQGDSAAKTLIEANYDTDVAIPDADQADKKTIILII